jgi:hypothetical protein
MSKEALHEALIGVRDQREEAFALLNAVYEVYLSDIMGFFKILTVLKQSPTRIC